MSKPLLKEQLYVNQANLKLEETAVIGPDGMPVANKKNLYMTGVFIQGDKRNHNRRVYPSHEIENAVRQAKEILANGNSILGELDHPEELTINLDRVTHMIVDMWMEGSDGYGKLKILPTPQGQLVTTLIEAGVKLGVSSRGTGDVDHNGYVSNFDMRTVDIVANPSAPDAYPTPIYEAFNGKRGAEIEKLANAVAHDPSAQKYLRGELMNFINKL